MARARTVLLLALAGCGGQSRQVQDCQPDEVLADPDGRGMRCVDESSECFDTDACTTDDVCCIATCEDPDGDRVFACGASCIAPDCGVGIGECQPGDRCETYSECSASCVPDMPCDAGSVVAGPDGNGFRCLFAVSTCFRPQDCRASIDPCCDIACAANASGRFECAENCVGDGPTDGDPG